MKVLTELNALAGFILEGSCERHLGIQFRAKTNVLQNRGHAGRRRTNVIRSALRETAGCR
jgi:hypothetical protein